MSSRLALGTVQFGLTYGVANQIGQVSRADAAAILAAACAGGLDMLDTAIAYGDSEACLGVLGVNHWRVISKLPTLPHDCPDIEGWVKMQLDGSLHRLGVDRLYGLLLHNPLQLLGSAGRELARALVKTRENGQVERIGVSIYSPDDLVATYKVLPIDLVQAPLNLVDRRLVDSGWLSRLADDGVEVHTRSSFLQGLLLMSNVPPCFSPWQALWTRWREWLSSHPGQATAACLAYPLSHPEVVRVVVGVDSLAQLTELLAAENTPVVDDLPDLRSYDELLINPSKWYSL
jgi:aryl-alcohol dehydrogenase-like predicted oxidoreductase